MQAKQKPKTGSKAILMVKNDHLKSPSDARVSKRKELKNDRIELRVEPHLRQQLELAASIRGETLTAFIRRAALELANKCIYERDRLELTLDDQLNALNGVLSPPEVPTEHRQIHADYMRMVKSGKLQTTALPDGY